jgi:multidrug resistance efflux pump
MKWLLAPLCIACFALRGAADESVLEVKGYVVAAHPVQVSPAVAGVLTWVDPRFEEGEAFKEGDVLAKIDDKEHQCDRDRAEHACRAARARYKAMQSDGPEEIKQAEAALDEAKASHDQLAKVAQRFAQLRQTGSASAEEADAASAAAEGAARKTTQAEIALERVKKSQATRLEAAEADIGTAEADLEKAQLRLTACEIRAPISGAILKKNAEKGDLIDPSAFNVAASLCEMADLADLEIDVHIPERDIDRVSKGQACTIAAEAYMAHLPKSRPASYEAKVSRILPVADRAQGAIPVRIRVEVPAREAGVYLRPDMGVIVSFQKAMKP